MKYFSCQPDSHNGFGSLTNGVLTYFTVDCARYGRVGESGIGGVPEPHTHLKGVDAFVEGGANPQRLGQRLSPTPSFSAYQGAGHSVAQHDVQFTTGTRVHTQCTLTLPNIFQTTQCCFSMANRTVFGTDMAFIGAANGLLALVVLQEDLLLYIRGKDPKSLREQQQRRQGQMSSTVNPCATSLVPTAASESGGGALRPPSPSSLVMALPSLSPSGGGGGGEALSSSSFICGTTAAMMSLRATSSFHGACTTSDISRPASLTSLRCEGEDNGLHRRDAPSTITWMRDKPLVLVGYTSGWVEWYEVSISEARRQELLDPAKESPYRGPVTSGGLGYQVPHRDSRTNRVAHVAVGGQRDGMRVDLVASCVLAETGALVSSDFFPANGTVAVGSERGNVFLFDTDQLEAPLCELRLSTLSASFLYCHPFLPIVGVLSQSVWAGANGLKTCTVTAAERKHSSYPTLYSPDSYSSILGRSSASQAVGSKGACGHSQCGAASGKESYPHDSRQKCASHFGAAPSAGSQGGQRHDRHVGWSDEGLAVKTSEGHLNEAFSIDGGVDPLFPHYNYAGSVSALHSGCVLTLVEYQNDQAPQKRSRAWSGAQSPTLSHRLTQVLQHRMEVAAARCGTYYTFSWKFSYDLELVIGNLEEGALRILRAARMMDRDSGADDGSAVDQEDTKGTGVVGERAARQPTFGTPSTPQSSVYQVVNDYTVRLPLHSLVNVEYVSAATASLSALDSAVAQPINEPVPRAMGTRGTAVEQSPPQRRMERSQRQTALLSAAVDPRCRLGYSSVSLSEEGVVAGVLCRPASPLWAGLAVVSLPHHGRRHKVGYSDNADHCVDQLDLFSSVRGREQGLYLRAGCRAGASPGAGCAGVVRASGAPANDYRPQLKESALAAIMLQPFHGGAGAAGGIRHYRRYTMGSNHSGYFQGGDSKATSNRWASLSTTASLSTQQLHHQRRRHHSPHFHAMHEPYVTVSSYPAKDTKSEAASAAVYTADQRVDLHGALRIGPGNVSYVVVMNAAGEVGSVPIEVRAVTAWHEEGSVFVGLGSTLYAADLVSIQGIEELMRRRHAAGFGLSSLANLAAVRKVGGYGSEDVALLFSYLVALEGVSLVALSGPVPSLMELLHSSPDAARGSTQREAAVAAARLQARLGPAWKAMMEVCVCHKDLCCFLVLQVLRWLPSSLTGEVGTPWRSLMQSVPLVDATPVLGENDTNTDIERAVAVEVTHGRYSTAAEVLLRFASRSPSYRAIATLLRRPEEAQSMIRNSDPRVCASFRASLTPWLLVIFHCLCRRGEEAPRSHSHDALAVEEGRRDGGAASQSALPSYLYRHSALPFWDRVALAVVMEAGTPAAFRYIMLDILLPESNPVQALLLQHGIHLRTHAAMQEIVDSTGDFQLGACLFARVGVLTAAAALAFPFLVDAEVSAAVTTERGVVSSPAAHSLSFGSTRAHEFSVMSSSPPPSCAVPDNSFGGCSDGSDDNSQARDTVYECSPFSYLRSSRTRRSPDQQSSASAGDVRVSLEEGVAHTALLVRNSVLPPPPQTPEGVGSGGKWRNPPDPNGVGSSFLPGYLLCYTVSASDTTSGKGYGGADGVILPPNYGECDDVGADVPWVWWAAAYRSFLDDEQAFVRRTTFDVECGQLRSCAFVARSAGATTTAASAATAAAALVSAPGVVRSSGRSSGYSLPQRTQPPNFQMMDARHSSSSPENYMSMSSAPRAASRIAGAGGSIACGGSLCGRSSPATASSCLLPKTQFFTGRGVSGAADVISDAPHYGSASMGSSKPTSCVCGEKHTGTQLIRSLLGLCRTTATRCSVCLEPVRLGTKDVATAFTWCTSCGHGGHAHHLQNWFRTHRRCPIDGCSCHCDEDSNLY